MKFWRQKITKLKQNYKAERQNIGEKSARKLLMKLTPKDHF